MSAAKAKINNVITRNLKEVKPEDLVLHVRNDISAGLHLKQYSESRKESNHIAMPLDPEIVHVIQNIL